MSDDKKPGGISRVASQMQSMFRKKAEETKLETEAGQGPKYLYSDVKDTVIGTEEDPSQAPLMEHLKELRQRLFVFVAVFFALTIGRSFSRSQFTCGWHARLLRFLSAMVYRLCSSSPVLSRNSSLTSRWHCLSD